MNNTFKLAAVSSAALMLAAAPAMAQKGPTLKLGGYYDQKNVRSGPGQLRTGAVGC